MPDSLYVEGSWPLRLKRAAFKSEQVPRVVSKAMRKQDEERHRKEVKAAVFTRDKGKCRVCGDPATEMHELQFRSLGGERSLANSIAVCAFGSRHQCHRLLQTHAIDVQGTDANKRLVFTWAEHIPKVGRTFIIRSNRRSQNR